MKRLLLTFVFAALLGACALSPPARTYTGIYAEGLETMTFQPEGQNETWAVAGGSGVYALQAAAPHVTSPDGVRAPFRVRATIRGELSRPGRYGHLGFFRRQITITEVLEATPADAR
jgi:hypothetical protein